MNVRVRLAGADDVQALIDLESDTLGADAWSPGLVAEGVRGTLPTVHWLIAEQGAVPVGHAVVSLAGEVAELQRIGVRADLRRTGVATRLLEAVVDLARSDGASRVLLEVREDNAAAVAFYDVRGFAELARRARCYRDGASALVLALDLPPS